MKLRVGHLTQQLNLHCSLRCNLYPLSRCASRRSSTPACSDQNVPPRKDTKKLSKPRSVKGNELPLPPLLNPEIIAAKNRWNVVKQPPKPSDIDSFREKVNNNPYVHALATPVRRCNQTHARLPSFFLRDLHMKQNPHDPAKTVHALPVRDTAALHRGVVVQSMPARFVNHVDMLDTLATFKDVRKRAFGDIHIPGVANVSWSPDLPITVRDLQRQQVIRKLELILRRKRGNDAWAVALDHPEDVSLHENVACVLFTGPAPRDFRDISRSILERVAYVEKLADREVQRANWKFKGDRNFNMLSSTPEMLGMGQMQPKAKYPKVRYPTMRYGNKDVPLYYLDSLLGQETDLGMRHRRQSPEHLFPGLTWNVERSVSDAVRRLMSNTTFENASWVALKGDKWTRAAQYHLLRLQGYLQRGV